MSPCQSVPTSTSSPERAMTWTLRSLLVRTLILAGPGHINDHAPGLGVTLRPTGGLSPFLGCPIA